MKIAFVPVENGYQSHPMISLNQPTAYVDRRFVKFHLPFLKAVVDPKHRGRHQILLEEPGWRILLWCLMPGMARPERRSLKLHLPQGVHAYLGVLAHTAARIGLSEGRFRRHLDRGVARGLWRLVPDRAGNPRFLELSPLYFWVGSSSHRDAALKAWGIQRDDSSYLQVGGGFLRRVLSTHVTGAGLEQEPPMHMNPSDWRFLFQVVLARLPGGIRQNGGVARFQGSIREIAKRLWLSHTALSEQLFRISEWEAILHASSPISVDCLVEDHPVRPAIAELVVRINPIWFQTPSRIWKRALGPTKQRWVIVCRAASHERLTDRWLRRYRRR